ncbi:hypothetical protein VP01_13194g2 [Puccinia sorghi]|uniref:Uncharacterized protein n=1 Tax=Puccinia sorghi TaxID=27349 RepID=A0A0L6VPH4_9BASI|nr:hypothetical protein VP01_13194g2 [Puccinia sorghi]
MNCPLVFAFPTQASSVHLVIHQKPKWLSLLPAISIDGLIAMKVREDTINSKRFVQLLKWDLVSVLLLSGPCTRPKVQAMFTHCLARHKGAPLCNL